MKYSISAVILATISIQNRDIQVSSFVPHPQKTSTLRRPIPQSLIPTQSEKLVSSLTYRPTSSSSILFYSTDPSAIECKDIVVNDGYGTMTKWEVIWYENLAQLQLFHETHGHFQVPLIYTEYPKLYRWVANQRQNYRLFNRQSKSTMTTDRMNALNAIGFLWDPRVDSWDMRFDELKDYRAKYGDCEILSGSKENPKLARWVRVQMQQFNLFRRNEKSNMTQDRIDALLSLGVKLEDNNVASLGGNTSKKRDVAWSERLEELVEYKREHGNCLVPRTYKLNPSFGRWVDTQRIGYRFLREGKQTSLTEKRVQELNEIGFVFEPREEMWMERFEELKNFMEEFGHTNVPQYFEGYPHLGAWTKIQRIQHRMLKEGNVSNLTKERIESLDCVGFFEENPNQKIRVPWSTRYKQLKEYKMQFGDCLVPQNYLTNHQLGQWVKAQRRQYKMMIHSSEGNCALTVQRVQMLNQIGFVWQVGAGRPPTSMYVNEDLEGHSISSDEDTISSVGAMSSREESDFELMMQWRQRFKAFH